MLELANSNERLTNRDGTLIELQGYFQNPAQSIPIGAFISAACKAFKKLAAYENIGYTPEEVQMGMSLSMGMGNYDNKNN